LTNPAFVVVTTSFPIASDGSEAAGSFVSDLAEELARHIPVRVVAPGSSRGHERWTPGVEVFRYAAPTKPLSTLKPWSPSDMVDAIKVLRAGARATLDAVGAGSTAHILALWALPSGEWARRVSHVTGVPYSVWTLGSDIWTLGRIPLIRRVLGNVLHQAHTCYSDGLKLADDTQCIAGREVKFLPSTRHIGSCCQNLLASQPPYRLLFLGRWHPNKGVDLLLDALDMLDDSDWSSIACVEIQGGGPLQKLVYKRVARLQARGRSVEAGRFLAKAEAEAAIARADWVLIPSRVESIPVVFSDAVKLGRPVIAMPVGDLPLLIEQFRCGITANSKTTEGYAQALRRGLASAPVEWASGVSAVAKQFDLPALATSLCALANGAEARD
jgi:glycosyltransferase involved in cell wall biosynthesis